MVLPLAEFVQGHSPNKFIPNKPSESSWRLGENRSVSSLIGSPTFNAVVRSGKRQKTNETQWRQGDTRTTPLGSKSLQRTVEISLQRQRNNELNNQSNWRNGDTRSTPLGSSNLDSIVQLHRTQVSSNPRAMSIRVKQKRHTMNSCNKTVSVVGSPTLNDRITQQRTSPQEGKHLRPTKSSPILNLGSEELQLRARVPNIHTIITPNDPNPNYALTQTFTQKFVANRLAPIHGSRMSWKDRAATLDEYYQHDAAAVDAAAAALSTTIILGRPTWISGNQRRPPEERQSIGWSANATRREVESLQQQQEEHELQWAAAGPSSPTSPLSPIKDRTAFFVTTGSPKREWRYGKRYFFHKAGKSMLRKAYL